MIVINMENICFTLQKSKRKDTNAIVFLNDKIQ